MNCILLNKERITSLYYEKMIKDFPESELRPLEMAFSMIDQGIYEGYALMEKDEILAYAFMISLDNSYLLDYLAVSEDKRNEGIGGQFLNILHDKFSFADSIIVEVEDPSCADNTEDEIQQTRRLEFYFRNGYRNTGLQYRVFGVDFLILETGNQKEMNTERIAHTYQDIYQSFLEPEVYEENIIRK